MSISYRSSVVCTAVLALLACGKNQRPAAASAFSLRVDSLVAEAMRDGKVPGLAVTIVRGDSVIHSKGYGFANLEQKVPMTDTTPVVIGSTSKTFTSFAMMQLVDSGRVSLDSTVGHYVAMLGAPGHANAPVVKATDARFGKITVRHMLTNVTGIPAGFSGNPYEVQDTSTGALERVVRDDMLPRPLDFAPGSAYRYSNRGFSLASLVVQDASGQSYEDYIASHIFAPLGMRHSTGRFWEGAAKGMVQGYRESVEGKPLPRNPSLGREWTGSGMILSTASDAARFLQTIMAGGKAPNGARVLSEASAAELLRGQQKAESELGGPTTYALAWEITTDEGGKTALKGGSVGSMGSLFFMMPEQKVGIVLVFNDIDYGKVQLLQNVLKLLKGLPSATYASFPAHKPVAANGYAMKPERLSAFAGDWDTMSGLMHVAVKGNALAGRHEGNDITLEPVSDSSFVVRSVLAEQEGRAIVIKRCGARMCMWINGDSSAVRR